MLKRLGGAVAVVVLVSSCGGALSLDDYYQRAADIRHDYRTVYNERGDAYEAEIAALAEDDGPGFAGATRRFVAETTPAYDEALVALEGLQPPGDVGEAHAAYLEAAHAYRQLLGVVAEGLDSASSVDEVTAVINGSGLAAAQVRVESACRRLEMLGADIDLIVDLAC